MEDKYGPLRLEVSTLTIMTFGKFDPDAQLPGRLQSRIDAWRDNPPENQFQAYGPLNAYLQGHKFKTDKFLVKPQALLREEDAGAEEQGELSVCRTINNSQSDVQMVMMMMMQETVLMTLKVSFWQNTFLVIQPYISSLGVAVTNVRKHPDFTICQFWGADVNSNEQPDVIRVVFEVASNERDKQEVVFQVLENLDFVGERFHDRILGVAACNGQE